VISFLLFSCNSQNESSSSGLSEEYYSAGDGTVFITGSQAYSTPIPTLPHENLLRHLRGDIAFETVFVTAGEDSPGVGPLFNNNSCDACHPSDGRGRSPNGNIQGGKFVSMFLRVSVGNDPITGNIPVPGMGNQLQDKAIYGETPEVIPKVNYAEQTGTYGDGTVYSLRVPTYSIESIRPDILYLMKQAGYDAVDIEISPRVAPAVFGRGFLEAIPEETILSFVDVDDRNGDGVSGRPNRVCDIETKKCGALGRFGIKAGTPTVLHQSAGAYNGDMGVTSENIFPDESEQPGLYTIDKVIAYNDLDTWYQEISGHTITTDFPDLTSSKYPLADPVSDAELSEEVTRDADFYVRTLGVPARRNVENSEVVIGK